MWRLGAYPCLVCKLMLGILGWHMRHVSFQLSHVHDNAAGCAHHKQTSFAVVCIENVCLCQHHVHVGKWTCQTVGLSDYVVFKGVCWIPDMLQASAVNSMCVCVWGGGVTFRVFLCLVLFLWCWAFSIGVAIMASG